MDLEDGELAEENSDSDNYQPRPVTIKRRRDSSSEGYGDPYNNGFDENNEAHFERSRDFGSPQFSRRRTYGNANSGAPRAHSSAGQVYGDRDGMRAIPRGRSQSRRSLPATQNVTNSTQLISNKMFKVEAFPKGVKPTDQFQEWSFWIANFVMAVEKAGTTSQRARAIDLSLHIGEEIRRVIVAKEMLPKESEVGPDFPFYNNLTDKLERHFRSLTDESVDVSSFNALKQGENETALKFEMRLRQLAKRVKETNEAMIRTRFIEGLRDQAVRERASIDGISLEEVVKMATRKEAIATKHQSEYSPWNDDTRSGTVAAVFRGHTRRGNTQRGAQRFSEGATENPVHQTDHTEAEVRSVDDQSKEEVESEIFD